jgi:hypothetical protein
MAQKELETFHIQGKEYVMPYHAARWLGMPLGDLEGQIALGKLELIQIESRQFIKLEALKAYASKRAGKR